MPFFQIFILLFFIFVILIVSLRYILSRNITRATGHLETLSKEYTVKQDEISRRLKEAKQEAQDIVAKAKVEAEKFRSQMLKETKEAKEKIIQDAHQKGEEMIQKAEKTCEFLKNEVEQKVEEGSIEKACALLETSLPRDLQKEIHASWMHRTIANDFHLGKLNLPENVKEIKIVSAFPLSGPERDELKKRLKKQLTNSSRLNEKVDSALVAGLVITVGNVVIDGTLKHQIQKSIQKNGQ